MNSMETKTIIVKDIKTKEGYTKDNKPWTRRTLISADGGYYSTFRNFPQPIKPGYSVTLEAKQAEGQKAGSFDITKIISVDANPTASGPAQAGRQNQSPITTGKGAGTPNSKAGKASGSSPDADSSLSKSLLEKGFSENLNTQPTPITDEQIEQTLKWAEREASKRLFNKEEDASHLSYEDIRFIDLVRTLFTAKLQQQEQTFALRMSNRIQCAKAQNIRQVQDTRKAV